MGWATLLRLDIKQLGNLVKVCDVSLPATPANERNGTVGHNDCDEAEDANNQQLRTSTR